ncbi:RNA dependent RNA polymerase-domain-containing protein [Flagelloscypha sp. PMI_526]|nr:RNA dependent RNA polymerase-domain-containing protein [Flagelloscypha sp. PMI_526]
MEIYVHEIDRDANSHDVTRAIASQLHGSLRYSRQPNVNFVFKLFSEPRARYKFHSGHGVLTVPSPKIGNRLLQDLGPDGDDMITLPWDSTPLRFRQSQRNGQNLEPDPGLLEQIRRWPYVEPEVAEERERRQAQLDTSKIDVKHLHFGCYCRDGVFSPEWTVPRRASLRFSRVGQLSFCLEGDPIFWIAIRFSKITSLTLLPNGCLLFRLRCPPSFEDSSGGTLRALPLKDGSREHIEVARYTSLALVVTELSEAQQANFLSLTRIARIAVDHATQPLQLKERALFSSANLTSFRSWIQEHSFDSAYQLQRLLRNYSLNPAEFVALRNDVEAMINQAYSMAANAEERIRRILSEFGLEALESQLRQENNPLSECLKAISQKHFQSPFIPLKVDRGSFMSYHAYITPTALLLDGPFLDRSNVVLREFPPEFHQYFLRVSFVDEGKLSIRHSRDLNVQALVEKRIAPVLDDGLRLLGRHYRFLAYSQSSLKSHTAWFMAEFETPNKRVSVGSIIKSIGEFSKLPYDPRLIYCPARFAARISQAFTATEPTGIIVENLRLDLPDITSINSKGRQFTHTDGVGTMSSDFARKVHRERLRPDQRTIERLNQYPRSLQIRLMGGKGMLSVDTNLEGLTVCLRPSMIKFQAPIAQTIEVAKFFDSPGRLFLNRPLIMVLESIGIDFKVFRKYQAIAVGAAADALSDASAAPGFFEFHGLGTSFHIPSMLKRLQMLHIMPFSSVFYADMMAVAITHIIRAMKHKGRIPISGGWNLPGICDIHDALEKGQIYICIDQHDGSKPFFIKGKVLIWRSPVVHWADVTTANAIGPPPPGSPYEVDPIANAVIFNVKDGRPLSTKLGGGDVDGDEYQIIPLEDHPDFASIVTKCPALYDPAPRHELDRKCKHEDIATFFKNYILNDAIGLVSSRALEIADQSPRGVRNEAYARCARLHSQAVDYPKTGTPINPSDIPLADSRLLPDWKAPETMIHLDRQRYYPSNSVLGKLYRTIDYQVKARFASWELLRKRRKPKMLGEDVLAMILADVSTSWEDQKNSEDLEVDERCPEPEPEPEASEISDKPIGDLMSASSVIQHFLSLHVDTEPLEFDHDIIGGIFSSFCSELKTICTIQSLSTNHGSMLSEAEAIMGTIVGQTRDPRRRDEHAHKLRELTAGLVRRTQSEFFDSAWTSSESQGSAARLVVQRASMAWEVSVRAAKKNIFGAQSFGVVALSVMFDGVEAIEREKSSP